MTIASILALKFHGNYAADCVTFALIDQFVQCADVSIADKCAALKYASEAGMGMQGEISETDLTSYLADL